MRGGHGRRRLTVVCKRRAMRAGHARRRLTVVFNPRPMQPGHVRRDLDQGRAVHADAGRPRPTSAERCAQGTADAARHARES
ncbi:hypothetical protein KY289_015275 [Solanum tuberosum]|nr:hypothetical protein KY289_015275 [Solanum tuberosum]